MQNGKLTELEVKSVMEPLMEGIKNLAAKVGMDGALVFIDTRFKRTEVAITPVKHKDTFKLNHVRERKNKMFRALVVFNDTENDCVLTVAR